MINLETGLILSLYVQGRPRTKGSMKCIGKRGKNPHQLIEDHPHSAPWRKLVQRQIVRHVRAETLGAKWEPFSGPVLVDTIFYFERLGPSAQLLAYPTVNAGENANGDEDKLRRNILDALEASGLISNDCMVVGHCTAGVTKRWAPKNLPPGVQITVRAA